MSRLLFLSIFILIYLSLDIYVYQSLKILFQSTIYNISYWAITVFFIASIFLTTQYLQDFNGIRPVWLNIIIGLLVAIFVSKLLLGGLHFIYDGIRGITGLLRWVGDISGTYKTESNYIPARRQLVSGIIGGIVAIPFAGFLYGITKGKYNYEVNRIVLEFEDLPDSFDGFKLVQISDIHSGSYDSYEQVEEGIKLINAENADCVVFTGDLVNSNKDEIDPFISAFKQINNKEGKFSITGNHDYYGMRSNYDNECQDYWEDFKGKHNSMGFDLILNENRVIQRGNDKIQIVGVENWGKGPFPKHGDLQKALETVSKDDFTILLSHDPTHWEEHALKHSKKIHLTLSGHTHGMQFGLNALGIKWSPIKYRYARWSGLYTEDNQHLYVNRGFGFLGFPGRVGMWPEITAIEFKKIS
jgi:predicted MPP superfamily phosphohydrolase